MSIEKNPRLMYGFTRKNRAKMRFATLAAARRGGVGTALALPQAGHQRMSAFSSKGFTDEPTAAESRRSRR
jgi:hypothetical protein